MGESTGPPELAPEGKKSAVFLVALSLHLLFPGLLIAFLVFGDGPHEGLTPRQKGTEGVLPDFLQTCFE